jgi:uncharacterized membrane protein
VNAERANGAASVGITATIRRWVIEGWVIGSIGVGTAIAIGSLIVNIPIPAFVRITPIPRWVIGRWIIGRWVVGRWAVGRWVVAGFITTPVAAFV